jgi:plasmid stabilization system protein ParE
MKSRRVVYEEQASLDLERLFDWLSEFASPVSATHVVLDLQDFIEGLDLAAERGTRRDDLRTDLRVIAHRRSVIAVMVDEDSVYIMRIFYGGEDWEATLRGSHSD